MLNIVDIKILLLISASAANEAAIQLEFRRKKPFPPLALDRDGKVQNVSGEKLEFCHLLLEPNFISAVNHPAH
ncbi:hypothetical protein ACTXT7_005762 [Hymenolepis weldensis]